MKDRKFYTICADNQNIGKNRKRAIKTLAFRIAIALVVSAVFLILRGSWVTIHWLGAGVVIITLLLLALVDFSVPKWTREKLRSNGLLMNLFDDDEEWGK
jgi:hypothetical protein